MGGDVGFKYDTEVSHMKKVLILFFAIFIIGNILAIPVSATEQNSTNVRLINECGISYKPSQQEKFAYKIQSVEELKSFLQRYPFPLETVYNENFFKEKTLFFLFITYSELNIEYEITSICENLTAINLQIERQFRNEAVPDETMTWALLFEMDCDIPEKEIWVNSQKIAEAPYKRLKFEDVPNNAWYADSVKFVSVNGLMNGSGDLFKPQGTMTRGMLVTVLWRICGSPEERESIFTDVPEDKYYANAVNWAAKNGIVNGIGNNRFNPEGFVTRQQMVTMLHNFDKIQMGNDTTSIQVDFSNFEDGDDVREYAVEAMKWAVSKGIITGSEKEGKLYLNPQKDSTRAQVATVLARAVAVWEWDE